MAMYNVVHRNESKKILVNCGHRHISLPAAISCQDAYLIAGLTTQVETADRDQQGHGCAVDLTVINLVREAMIYGTLHARDRRGLGLVQEMPQGDDAQDR